MTLKAFVIQPEQRSRVLMPISDEKITVLVGMAAKKGVNVDVRSMHYTDDKTDKPYHRLEAEFSQYFAINESNTIAYRSLSR